MSVSVLYMSMSVDGYIAGPNDEPSNPGGDGFDRLHEWYWDPAAGDFVRSKFTRFTKPRSGLAASTAGDHRVLAP
jgi:hypothetical protein